MTEAYNKAMVLDDLVIAQEAATDAALRVFTMITQVRGGLPVTDEDIDKAKALLMTAGMSLEDAADELRR